MQLCYVEFKIAILLFETISSFKSDSSLNLIIDFKSQLLSVRISMFLKLMPSRFTLGSDSHSCVSKLRFLGL